MGDYQMHIFTPTRQAHQVTGVVSARFLLTLADQLTTLPMMAYYFMHISLTAANIRIIVSQQKSRLNLT